MTEWIKYKWISKNKSLNTIFILIAVFFFLEPDLLFCEPVYFFAPSSCSKCRNLYRRLESIKQYDPLFQIYGFDPYTNQGRQEYQNRWKKLEIKNQQDYYVFPAIFVGDTVLTGMEITDSLLLYYFYGNNQKNADAPLLTNLSWLSVIILGLGDGINPCAFSVLLFLLSYMTLKNSTRRRILISAWLFILGIFLFYFILGVGVLRFLKSFIVIIPYFAIGIKLTAIALGIFAVFSITTKVAKKKIYLSGLSRSDHRKIHKWIKWGNRSFLPLWFLIGVMIGLAELMCTGQIYFPTLVMINQFNFLDTVYLLLYNIFFVLPLIILVVSYIITPNFKFFENLIKHHYSKIMMFIAVLISGLTIYLVISIF